MTIITSVPAAASRRGSGPQISRPSFVEDKSGPQISRPSFVEDKLHIPYPSFPVVPRRRVIELIRAASRHRVTLVCAPPGSGKTVACASWAGGRREAERIVWVSLGADDGREWFWAYVCAGLRRAGVQPTEVIHSLDDVCPAAFPLRLVGAAQLFSEPVVLVLDNVHEVRDNMVLSGLAFLIHHAPAGLRLVLSGCHMPPGLQLARLPVSDLVDIGARELACTAREADAFLARLGIEMDAAERDELLWRTAGSIAGLRLAVAGRG